MAAALGAAVVATRPLAGGFSHETCLLTLTGGQVVVRLGGPDPAVEAAVMDAARGHVPVPRVLHVLPAEAGDGAARPAMVLEYVAGTPLSQVLQEAGRDGVWELGAEVGRLDAATRRAWSELCTAHAPALGRVDQHSRLVHADVDPKNILVVTRTGGGWRVDAVLDWEFSYSGCPYGDAANMIRFAADYPAAFTAGFRAAFAACRPADLPPPGEWAYLGRVLDMFALSDLVTRPGEHPVADQAAGEIRRWVADGVPDAR